MNIFIIINIFMNIISKFISEGKIINQEDKKLQSIYKPLKNK